MTAGCAARASTARPGRHAAFTPSRNHRRTTPARTRIAPPPTGPPPDPPPDPAHRPPSALTPLRHLRQTCDPVGPSASPARLPKMVPATSLQAPQPPNAFQMTNDRQQRHAWTKKTNTGHHQLRHPAKHEATPRISKRYHLHPVGTILADICVETAKELYNLLTSAVGHDANAQSRSSHTWNGSRGRARRHIRARCIAVTEYPDRLEGVEGQGRMQSNGARRVQCRPEPRRLP